MRAIKDRVNPQTLFSAELDHLLEAVLGRKTNQGLILGYLGQLHLRGEESAKELAIAVDALGRGPDFDPKREAIVRVEIHKLRRTLKAYYAGPGQDRPTRIGLALGKYALTVEHADAPPSAPSTPLAVVIPPTPPTHTNPLLWVLLAIVALIAIAYVARSASQSPATAATPPPVPIATPTNSIRILAGSPDRHYVDSLGHEWLGDRFFTGGRAVDTPSAWIHNTPDQVIYKGHREGDFLYEIPLPPGDYEVRIHFAETLYGKDALNGGGEASRLFQVLLNGKVAVSPMDVILHAGGSNMALMKAFPGQRPETDGKLRIRFESNSNDKAFVNAIEIVPGLKDKLLPFRLAVGAPTSHVDAKGRIWMPDRYITGGRTVERLKPVQAEVPELFRYERFGRFEYNLPAVPGHQYQLNVWGAEQYFGVHTPAGPKPRRVFDIFSNGLALARDVSLADIAGGPVKAAHKTFSHLLPDAQGNIRVLFAPTENYAAINALELIDEGPTTRLH
jgi:hypothetical protein